MFLQISKKTIYAVRKSLIFSAICAIGAFLTRLCKNSAIVTRFLSQSGRTAFSSSVLTRGVNGAGSLAAPVFKSSAVLRLIFGSIALQPWVLVCAVLFLAPLIPTMVLLAAAAVTTAVTLAHGIYFGEGYRPTAVDKWLLFVMLAYFSGVMVSSDRQASLFPALLYAAFCFFAFTVKAAINSKAHARAAVFALVLSATAVSLHGLAQRYFGWFLPTVGTGAWLDKDMFEGVYLRVYATLENPNVLAEYLDLIIPFTFAIAVTEKSKLIKLVSLGCLAAQLMALLYSYSRGGWIATIAAIAVFLIALDRRFVVLLVLGGIGGLALMPAQYINRLMSVGNITDRSTLYRLYIWLGTIDMVKDGHWQIGIGVGETAFASVYRLYDYGGIVTPHSHNLFLQFITESGVLGLVSILGAFFSGIRQGMRAFLSGGRTRLYSLAAACGILGFFVQSMTDFGFYNYRVTFVFWCVLGLAAAMGSAHAADGEKPDPREKVSAI
ncbi:MAG: O-antigen ligase family protein [Oscillospiraceae bacterium]|jgi:O-antigen ligase|nr:O-antigen ligase family protein [Oscillospiraceae bacterium]